MHSVDNRVYNILVDYMKETDDMSAFKVVNAERGHYKIAIYTRRPGLLIGKGGSTLSKYEEFVKNIDKYFDGFDINEIDFILNGFNSKISDEEYYAVMNDFFMSHGM